jgi:aminoglycoside phosphotransferase (APT) family kinase protein
MVQMAARRPVRCCLRADIVAAVTSGAPDLVALARVIGRFVGEIVEVSGLRRCSGGASRETWALDATDAHGRVHELILRRDPESQANAENRATEYAVIAAADLGGVPVPRVRALLGPDDELGAGFLMDRVDGETIPRRILRDAEFNTARPRLARESGMIAARIHAVDTEPLPPLPVLGARAQIEQQRSYLDAFGEPHPALELGLRWLDEHAPAEQASPALVHGDFRNGNFIVGADGIRAVLDWELSHLGDPIEDLGWLCVKSWRFGNADQIVGGFGSLDQLLDAYADVGGVDVSEDAVRFWVVLGTLKWGVICAGQALLHVNGLVRSVELAALGRRVAEMEWDLLDLLDGGW